MRNTKSDLSILFLGKNNDAHCEKALKFIANNFKNISCYLGEWGESLPEGAVYWEGDYILSYLSRWIVPEYLLKRARKSAINFHPAPPDYPGIGCNNFALYEEANEYGVTCHYMLPKVDTGEIIAAKRFPIFLTDDISSLLTRTYDFQLTLFYEIVGKIINREKLPLSNEKWLRKPFTRGEFNELFNISLDMDSAEIKKRIRATYYAPYKPLVKIGGYEFELKIKK
ncbi:MAG: hypothetical protein LBQ52_02535 [Helicobacteraceae bacterium]|jgi:methionyl-tRNA formyltransferase|nr:hypothetical protein [Helicobacteraceae bacterium]